MSSAGPRKTIPETKSVRCDRGAENLMEIFVKKLCLSVMVSDVPIHALYF